MFKRKQISICANDIEPSFVITYTINKDSDTVENLQYWVKEELQHNISFLYIVSKMIMRLKKIPFLNEKRVFQTYQDVFDIGDIYNNYKLSSKHFKMLKLVKQTKPHLGFIEITNQQIDITIKNYIEKGEL